MKLNPTDHNSPKKETKDSLQPRKNRGGHLKNSLSLCWSEGVFSFGSECEESDGGRSSC